MPDLIRRDQVKTEKIASLRRLAEDGQASGVSTLTPEQLFEKIRNRTLRPKDDEVCSR